MGYTSLQIGEILLKADRTMYKIGSIAYDNMFSENDESLDYKRDIIYIYKKAVEWGDDYYIGTTKLDKIVERIAAYIAIYDYGTLTPVYSSSVGIVTSWVPQGAALNDLTDVTITNVLDKQYLRYDSSSGQWINFGSSATIRSSESFNVTSNQTTFVTTYPFDPNFMDIYLNGVKLNSTSYTVFGQHSIILNDYAVDGDILDVVIYDALSSIVNPPSQIGNAGKYLTTNGSSLSWGSVQSPISITTTGTSGPATFVGNVLNIPQYEAEGNYVNTSTTISINGVTYDLSANRTWSVGTVSSVNMSVPTGLTISGNPITGSGTLALSYASGYSIPATVKQSNWDDAYTWVAAFPTQTGNNGKYLTTNGSVLSWSAVDALPSQTGNAGKYLTTNGTTASWATIDLSAYVPTSRTLTINGTTYDLTANRTWSVGTVTSVQLSAGTGISLSGTNPITSSGTITVTNSAPDQIVTITAGENISVSGTYPNFTVSAVGETISSFLLMGA